MPKILTQAQIDQFWNEGYVFPFDCLTADEAAAVRAKIEAYESTIEGNASRFPSKVERKVYSKRRWARKAIGSFGF